MRAKTHPIEDEDYEEIRDGDGNLSPLPNFTKSPLIITKKMINSRKNRQSSILSSSSKSDQTMNNMDLNRPTKFNLSSSLGSLMAVLSPSPVSSSPSPTATFSSPSSLFHCEYSRASREFYTPTHQSSSVLSRSMSLKKQSEQSPKCMSISTIYESAKDHVFIGRGGLGFDSHGNGMRNYTYSPKSLPSSAPPHDYESSSTTTTTTSGHAGASFPVLPSVPEEVAAFRQRRGESGKPFQFARVVPVRAEQEAVAEEEEEDHPTPVNRPRPYQEFLEEVHKHRRSADLNARRKAVYTRLLDQLRRKEAVIDDWESKRKSKEEFKLEKTERHLEKKRAKALQKMHHKVEEINMEAERKKARERGSFLKKMDKLCGQIQPNKKVVTATMLWNTWSCCCLPGGSQETP